MNTANPVVRVTLLLSVFYKHRLFAAWHNKSKRSSKETSGTVLALKNLWSKIQTLGRVPRRDVLYTWLFCLPYCYPNLSVTQASPGWGPGGCKESKWRKGMGRENVFSSTGLWLFSGSRTTTDQGYTGLHSSTPRWADSTKEGGIKVALTLFLLPILKFSFQRKVM